MKKQSTGKKDTSLTIHIALGILVCLIVSFLLSILITVLIEKEAISINNMNILMPAAHALSVLIGSLMGISKEQGRIAVIIGVIAACYLLVLVCINMLVFSEGFDSLSTGIFGVLSGGVIAILTKSKTLGSKKRHVKMRSR